MISPRVLLIEPDQVIGSVIASVLASDNWQVDHALTAQSAITKADKNRPDLVILELQLVSHSGIEFLYEFRSYQDWQSVPVIVFSSVPLIEFAGSEEGLSSALGVEKYLYKPNTSLRELIRAARQTLSVNEAV